MKLFRAVCAAVLLSACASDSIEPLPLSISVTATPATAAVGDSVTFVASSQGTSLVAVTADFGDGATDGFQIPFGRTARNTFKHAYSTAGSYTATFTIVQADSATKSATASVQIH